MTIQSQALPTITATAELDFAPTTAPTFYFVGVTTGRSSIMRVFPRWAEHLGLGKVAIQGIDCKLHDDPAVYRNVVNFIKHDPNSLGGLVTSHKLDLLDACRDQFDELDVHAQQTGEISCISKRDGRLLGHAKDPITAGLSLEAFLPHDHWRKSRAPIFIMGAGGSSVALTSYLMQATNPADRPSRIIVSNRSPGRLNELEAFHESLGRPIPVAYHLAPRPEDNDALLGELPPHGVVVNATGLGKDAPGSPLSDHARFPEHGYAWEFNYRGDLLFLDQAKAKANEKHLHVEDGWVYFIHGWTRVIAEVFDLDIPTHGRMFDQLCEIARQAR